MIKAPSQPVVEVEDCSMARALQLVGDHWTLLVLREAFYGVRRFGEMQDHLEVARNVLADRLERLVGEGLLERVPYKDEGQRTRHEYRLTRKGTALLPALIALMQWGDEYQPNPKGRPLLLRDRETGQEVRVELVRADGRRLKSLRQLEPVFWPGGGAEHSP